MKIRLLFLAGSVLAAISMMAQAPEGMNYQAVARNSSGDVIKNQAVGIKFSIHSGTPSGTVVYAETDTASTNEFGLFTTVIGSGTVVTGTFSGINWSSTAMFLDVAIDPTGGTSYSDMGTKQLESVPYALYAGGGSSLWTTGASNAIYNTNTGEVGIGTSTPGAQLDIESGNNISVLNLNSSGNTLMTLETGDSSGFYLQFWNGSTYFYNYDATDMSFGVSESTDMLHLSAASLFVGIGTATPWTKLDVQGDLSVGTSSATNSFLYLRTSGDTSFLEGYPVGLVVSGGQDGSASPQIFLSNVSNAVEPNYTNHTSLGGSGVYWTAVYATNGAIQTSDERLKKNVQNLDMGLKQVMALRPVSYEWKDAQSGVGEKIGFIAQEVEKIVPQAVVHDYISDKEIDAMKIMKKPLPEIRDPYAMSYSEMIPVLTRAIQEQQAQIEKLQKEVERLSNK